MHFLVKALVVDVVAVVVVVVVVIIVVVPLPRLFCSSYPLVQEHKKLPENIIRETATTTTPTTATTATEAIKTALTKSTTYLSGSSLVLICNTFKTNQDFSFFVLVSQK